LLANVVVNNSFIHLFAQQVTHVLKRHVNTYCKVSSKTRQCTYCCWW